MSEQSNRIGIQAQIDRFVGGLSEVDKLDPEVVAIVQRLHRQDRLDSRSLLRELDRQRQEWADGETP